VHSLRHAPDDQCRADGGEGNQFVGRINAVSGGRVRFVDVGYKLSVTMMVYRNWMCEGEIWGE
jgi:hypothetical protein